MSVHVLGESLVDVLPGGPRVGGSPLNVAVGLAAAGRATVLWTALGQDEYGDLVRAHLDTRAVSLEALTVDRTGTACVQLDGGEATYELDIATQLPVPDLSDADALHVGSVAALTEPGAEVVREAVARAVAAGVPVSYDPNLRPGFDARDAAAVRALAAEATVVKLSEADARLLAPGVDPDETADGLLTGRTELVVLTRGAAGAIAYSLINDLHVVATADAVPTTVVDTVGAGDAFMAGLIAAAGRPIADRLHAAAEAAAACCARPGA